MILLQQPPSKSLTSTGQDLGGQHLPVVERHLVLLFIYGHSLSEFQIMLTEPNWCGFKNSGTKCSIRQRIEICILHKTFGIEVHDASRREFIIQMANCLVEIIIITTILPNLPSPGNGMSKSTFLGIRSTKGKRAKAIHKISSHWQPEKISSLGRFETLSSIHPLKQNSIVLDR